MGNEMKGIQSRRKNGKKASPDKGDERLKKTTLKRKKGGKREG